MLKHFVSQWQQLFSNELVLEMVQGAKILISDFSKLQTTKNNQVPGHLWSNMDQEVEKLLTLGVVQRTDHEEDEVISPVVLVQKPDGSYRMILNLKQFNEAFEYQHFKMENLSAATKMMRSGCYMASVDLRHVCCSVPMHLNFRQQHHHQHLEHKDTRTCRETSGTNTRNEQVQMEHPWTL